jgi:PAS domain S-box-containing protein
MFGATIQAALTILVAAPLATYVRLRAGPTPLRTPLLALILALITWSAGVILRFSARSDEDAYFGILVTWAGAMCTPPLWALLAARWARLRPFESRPRLAFVLFIPGALAWLTVASNPWHHLFFRTFSAHRPATFGPLFYAHLAVAYGFVLVGIALFLLGLRRPTVTPRRDAVLLVIAAVLPTTASVLFVFGPFPLPFDPTPGTFALSLVIFTFGVFRYQLLDALPLARGDAVDHLSEGVLIADASGATIDANPAALALLGGSAASARGLRLAELLAPLCADPSESAALAARFESLAPERDAASARLRTRDDRHLEITARCLRAPEGGILGRLVVLRDRTEEHRHETLLRQSQKLETVGRLVAGVAHEVNNPLAFVRANLGHLARVSQQAWKRLEHDPRPEVRELGELPQIAAECCEGIDRIKRIVDAMRGFARPAGEAFAALDLNDVVRVAVRISGLRRPETVRVALHLDEALPPVIGSAARLEQVVLNLLVNAAQALEERGGTITVCTRRAGGMVELEVCDDGPGVPEAHRERVFDPFFTTRGPEQGTGLGLSIAYDIAREHGGTLALRVPAGPGACFVVRLPGSPASH